MIVETSTEKSVVSAGTVTKGDPAVKLAEALIQRKSLQTKLARLRDRLIANAVVQEGDTPSEDPVKLRAAFDACCTELEALICRINKTNSETLCDGVPLGDLITRRDMALRRIGILREVTERAANRADRASGNEIRCLATINVSEEQDKLDAMSAEARLLDARIQAKNWETDLL